MIAIDRGSLICDLAETYGIYDYRSLPASTIATLSVGLRDNSRIKTKLRGGRAGDDIEVMLALVHDRLSDILYSLGAYKKQPESLACKLLGIEENTRKDGKDVRAYSSSEEFERARKGLIENGNRIR